MKKVGIISMQRIINYGSFLQSYGLYSTIKKIGYDVNFIDYHYDGTLVDIKKTPFLKKILRNLNMIDFLKKRQHNKKFKEQITNALKEIGVNDDYNYDKNIDSLVIGSDEVFNCMQGFPVGYSLELFGKGFENKNIISYAASFGYTTAEMLKKYNKETEIGNLLNKFNAISVRDENSYKIVENLCNRKSYINLDPVLIADYSKFIKSERPIKENYIIIYAYPKRFTKEEQKYIKLFARKHNKKIISLGFYQEIADYNLPISPFDVFTYFKYADYVITDTFHGTIFSIKVNTKFCTIVRKSNLNKLSYLLKTLEQEDRMVRKLEDIETLYDKKINYEKTNLIIKNETEKSIHYLQENI